MAELPNAFREIPENSPLLSCGRIVDVRIDITTLCNLRCVYCPVSQSDYSGAHMDEDVAYAAVNAVSHLVVHNPVSGVSVNGHGETTYSPHWMTICDQLLKTWTKLNIITNLAKPYSDAELGVLARMDTIAVSIDSSDRALMKRMRRKVDVRRIVSNIFRIRAKAKRLGLPPPTFHFSTGLYDKSAPVAEDLAWLAISLGIAKVTFWNLVEHSYANTDVPEADQVHTLASLPDVDLRVCIAGIDNAAETLADHGIVVEFVGDFLAPLKARLTERAFA